MDNYSRNTWRRMKGYAALLLIIISSLAALLRSIGLRLAIQPDQPYGLSAGTAAVAEERAEYTTENENND